MFHNLYKVPYLVPCCTAVCSFLIKVPLTFGISANDERTDPGDLTDTLWSNTVTLAAT